VAAVVGAAPESLNTLQELSAALANDASFATTVTNSLAGKANVSHTHTVSAISDAGTAATRNVPATGNAGTTEVVLGSDTRLTDSRTPTSHAHGSISNFGTISDQISTAQANPVAFAGLTGLIGRGAWGTTSGTFCQGNDSRLSDARTPTAHKSTHATGGSDALAPADIGAAAVSHTHSAADLTSGTVATARLGSGTADATTYLRGDQTWQVISTTPTVASPSQITENQNDYAGATADINRLSADAARDITGLSAGTSGQTVVLVNVGSAAITLKHQNTGSSAANRIIVPWAGDYIMDANGAAVLVYDNTTSRWRVI
jgi:hypothetical protein